MNPADTILRLAEIIARYETTFQADKAAIAQLQAENTALKAEKPASRKRS